MIEQFAPGQEIRVTITEQPRRSAQRKTLRRLMGINPEMKKALTKAQEHRRRTLPSHMRGGRMWAVRPRASLITRAEKGASWTMPFFPQVAPDLESVSGLVRVEAA